MNGGMKKIYFSSVARAIDRELADGTIGTIGGLALPYGTPTNGEIGGAREVVLPDALGISDFAVARWQHSPYSLLGSAQAGTLRVEKRADGIHIEVDLPDTADGRDCLTLVRRGDVGGISIGAIIPLANYRRNRDPTSGEEIFEISGGMIHEFSIVDVPAYPTNVQERSVFMGHDDFAAKKLAEVTRDYLMKLKAG